MSKKGKRRKERLKREHESEFDSLMAKLKARKEEDAANFYENFLNLSARNYKIILPTKD